MLERTGQRAMVLGAIVAIFFLSCVLDEDLRINADGSGTYRVRISIPKALAQDFGDLRKEAEKSGFAIVQEGETAEERFLIIRKEFEDVSALNDSQASFELSTTETGFLRREYRLRASLKSLGFGSFKRRLTVTMPGKIATTTQGDIDGSRVRWEGSAGGTLEIVASGFYFPLTDGQKGTLLAVAVGGLLLLFLMRRRRRLPPSVPCATCHSPLRSDARFCGICGTSTPVTEP